LIKHIVTWKLKAEDAEGKAESFAAIVGALGALPPLVPAIHSLHLGADLAETEGNWDVVLITEHESPAELAAYQVHQEHLKATAVVRELVSGRSAVDFEF
jgi:Stress responsive A/B Barrel Domain